MIAQFPAWFISFPHIRGNNLEINISHKNIKWFFIGKVNYKLYVKYKFSDKFRKYYKIAQKLHSLGNKYHWWYLEIIHNKKLNHSERALLKFSYFIFIFQFLTGITFPPDIQDGMLTRRHKHNFRVTSKLYNPRRKTNIAWK